MVRRSHQLFVQCGFRCTHENLPNETPCDDGNPCSEEDACYGGHCVGLMCASSCCDPTVGICEGMRRDQCCDTCTWTIEASCFEVDCQAALGACCDYSPGAEGYCTDHALFIDCLGSYHAWTPEVNCAQITCTELTGACCDGYAGTCTLHTLGNCTCQGCIWHHDRSCEQINCTLTTGACCRPDSDPRAAPQCTPSTYAECQCEGCLWRPGVSCNEYAVCNPGFSPIPAVSAWGVGVLSLLLLIAAKLRQPPRHRVPGSTRYF